MLCHGPDSRTRKAELRLDVKDSALRSKDPIIVLGKSVDSELIRRVETDDADELMPPPKSGRKLTSRQKVTLKRWVDQGAGWGKHWAFKPLVRPELPRVTDSAWARNSIDVFVLARLEQEGLKPSPEADRTTLIRRLGLDLTGLPPTLAEVDAFKPYQPDGLWEELAGGAGEGPYVQDKGDKLYRRSLYVYRKRTVPHPAMATFDAPSREFCQVKRARTNTPLQALELLNDITYVEAVSHLAQLMMAEGGRSPQERVRYAFRRATSRSPNPAELQIILRGLDRYRQSFQAHPESASE